MQKLVLTRETFRLYPNKSQVSLLSKIFGCNRFVWNNYTSIFKNQSNNYKSIKDLSNEFEFLKEVPSVCLNQIRRDFEATKKQFFNKNRKTKLKSINFKKKGKSKNTCRFSGSGITRKYDKIYLTKLGIIKIKGRIKEIDLPHIKSISISLEANGKYYVSVCYEKIIEETIPKNNIPIGLDLGLTHFIIDNQGNKIENLKFLKLSLEKLKFLDRCLSRKKKGSVRYKKAKLKRARLHKKISDQRKYFMDCVSKNLVDNYDTIILEDLSVKNMIKNRKLSRSIQDVSWSKFVSILEYKCNWYGRKFHKINRFFASSKICSECGYKLDKLDLSVREWICPDCEMTHDRDINAAKNIRNRGLFEISKFKELSSKGTC